MKGRKSQAVDQCMYPPTTRYCGEETYTRQQHGITYQHIRICTRIWRAEKARLLTSVYILPQRVIAARKHTLVDNMASHISTLGSALEYEGQKKPGCWPVYVSSHNALLRRGNIHLSTAWHICARPSSGTALNSIVLCLVNESRTEKGL